MDSLKNKWPVALFLLGGSLIGTAFTYTKAFDSLFPSRSERQQRISNFQTNCERLNRIVSDENFFDSHTKVRCSSSGCEIIVESGLGHSSGGEQFSYGPTYAVNHYIFNASDVYVTNNPQMSNGTFHVTVYCYPRDAKPKCIQNYIEGMEYNRSGIDEFNPPMPSIECATRLKQHIEDLS